MSAVAAPVATVGPWAFLTLLILMPVWAYCVVWLVLTKSVRNPGDSDVSVKVRPFPWPRIEIEVRAPARDLAERTSPHTDESSEADVVPLREDVRESG